MLPNLLESGGFAGPVYTANMFQCASQVGAYDFAFGEEPSKVVVPYSRGANLAYESSQAPDYIVVVDTLGDRAHLIAASRFTDRRLAKTELARVAVATVVISNIRSPGTRSV